MKALALTRAILILLLGCLPALSQDAATEARSLCASGAPISRIEISSVPVFDPADPASDNWLYRGVNWLHRPMQTRPSAVSGLLAIRVGDRCSIDSLEEAERQLRALGFLQDAWVEPAGTDAGGVVVRVRVQDSWSTRIGFSFAHEGGESTSRLRLLEENLFGYGKRVEIARKKDQDRDEKLIAFVDPAVMGSRWQASLAYSDNSDGELRLARFHRPFWSLDARWMLMAEARNEVREEKVYEASEEIDRWSSDLSETRVHAGFSRKGLENGRVLRWFLEVERTRERWSPASPGEPISRPDLRPYDRDTITAGARVSLRHIDIRRVSRIFGDRRVEDLDLGREISAGLATSIPGLSEDDAGRAVFSVRQGFALEGERYLLASASQSIQWLRGGYYDTVARISLRYHARTSSSRTLVLHGAFDRGEGLSGPNLFLLGGDTGFRAYRSRAFAGTRRLLVGCELRFFTDLRIGQVLGVGFVTFLELGGAWEEGIGLSHSVLHPGLGLGLRLPVLPSARGTTVHLNAAMPLDPNGVPGGRKLRLSVSTALSF